MIKVQFPPPSFRMKNEQGNELIFDAIRKKWMVLTPEEWVRQNFVQYLVTRQDYPSSVIAIEKEIRLGELKKRFDILIYDREHKPWMLVECKGMEVELSQSVLDQAIRYNMSVPVDYIIITNGKETYGWYRGEAGLIEIEKIPDR